MPEETELFEEGKVLFEKGHYQEAISKFIQVLTLVKDTNNHTLIFNAHIMLGECFHCLEDFDEAMYYFHKAHSLAEDQNDLFFLATSQVNLAKLLVKDPSSIIEANYYLEEAIRLFDQLNDEVGLEEANALLLELKNQQKHLDLTDIFPSAVTDVHQKIDEPMATQHQALVDTFLKKEIIRLQSLLVELLDELRVNLETPIMKGRNYQPPDIKAEDYSKILPLISRYEKILTGIDSFVNSTVPEIVDTSILVRIGNLYYWKALSSQLKRDYEKAIEFYMRANQLKADPPLALTIGSIFRKIGYSAEAQVWTDRGFSMMRKRPDDDSRLPYPYIYYFPYPKGPPVASAEPIPKHKVCPMCQKLLDYDTKICPVCEYQFEK